MKFMSRMVSASLPLPKKPKPTATKSYGHRPRVNHKYPVGGSDPTSLALRWSLPPTDCVETDVKTAIHA